MSRKKTQAQLEQEAWEADYAAAELAAAQERCDHYRAAPSEWHWKTGQVRQLECPECGATRYFEETE